MVTTLEARRPQVKRTKRIRDVNGKVVLVTGAARGMGLLYCRYALAEGARAVIGWDADAAALAEASAELGERFVPVPLDITDTDAVERAAAAVLAEHGAPDVLINNAGIVRGKLFVDHTRADIDATMHVNLTAPLHTTRAFLPAMLEAPEGRRIVNIASAAGLLANPRMSVYASSKWGLVGWSDSLRLELAPVGIGVTTVCPSYVATGMFEGARGPRWTPILDPERIASAAWRAMKSAKPFLLMPAMVHVSKVGRGLLPPRVWDLVGGRWFRVYSSMDAFTGRATQPK
ncbi:SDR family NAD(P)-dependent oxidoreductase [Protaetiibacter intestinalis]|uniref:SDR family NAD(P)-dependent oxidoreductase n=1 Tax=Protaetiibacter intestinalis TaxID=2419774 RepID=A0A387B8I2_9MICO|nr:SDR family NAD(P)-dependent oxidoreductase [Protaetiibacter intestinalis]